MDRGAWSTTVHWVARLGHNLGTKPPPIITEIKCAINAMYLNHSKTISHPTLAPDQGKIVFHETDH